MINLEQLNVNLDDISFKAITQIVFIMKNGSKVGIGTPFAVADFTEIWNSKRRKIKIATGKDSYVFIDKKYVVFYHIFPVKN